MKKKSSVQESPITKGTGSLVVLFMLLAGLIVGAVLPFVAKADRIRPHAGDACGEKFTYEKSSDFSDFRVSIDFERGHTRIDVSAERGYSVVKVELDVEGDGHGGYRTYAYKPVSDFNPRHAGDIRSARITVKKKCPDACPNIPHVQYEVPSEYIVNDGGQCVLPPADVCPNIDGTQESMPEGYELVENSCTMIPTTPEECSDEVQSEDCVVTPPEPTVDLCLNLEGEQSVIPQGYESLSTGQCTLITPACTGTQTLNEETNTCVDEYVPPTCDAANQHLEGEAGNAQCVNNEAAPPADLCSNIEGTQTEVPSGKHIENENQCVDNAAAPAPTGNGSGNGGNGPIAGSLGGGGNGPIAGSLGGNNNGSIFGGGMVLGASTSTLPGLPAGCSALLSGYMRIGKKNDTEQVKKLQEFLNKELNADLEITGFFGQATDKWVRVFQKSHEPQVLTPWGISESTGYVYKTTQRWINLTSCKSLVIPMPVLN